MGARNHLLILGICLLGAVIFTRGDVTHRYRVNSTAQTWFQAFESCYNMAWGSKLAIFDIDDDVNAEENILDMINDMVEGELYFIGAHDLFNEGHYLDIEGKELRYIKWYYNEPNNYNGSQNCIAVNKGLKMFDLECDYPRYAICMIPKEE